MGGLRYDSAEGKRQDMRSQHVPTKLDGGINAFPPDLDIDQKKLTAVVKEELDEKKDKERRIAESDIKNQTLLKQVTPIAAAMPVQAALAPEE